MPCKAVAFIGRSGSGKTTLITKMIPFLAQGLKVGTIKRTHHQVGFDQEGKDSWKHRKAGASQVVLLSEKEMAVFSKKETETSLESIRSKWFSDFDLLIVEGFKNEPVFKIEIIRAENNKSPLYQRPNFEVDAIVTDLAPPFPVPYFDLNDIEGLSHWICQKLDLVCST